MILLLMDAEEWESKRQEAIVAVPGQDGCVNCCDPPQVAFVLENYFPSVATTMARELWLFRS